MEYPPLIDRRFSMTKRCYEPIIYAYPRERNAVGETGAPVKSGLSANDRVFSLLLAKETESIQGQGSCIPVLLFCPTAGPRENSAKRSGRYAGITNER